MGVSIDAAEVSTSASVNSGRGLVFERGLSGLRVMILGFSF